MARDISADRGRPANSNRAYRLAFATTLELQRGIMRLRALACLAIATALVSAAEPEADRAADIVRLHIAAIGGQERIDALHAYRAEGRMGDDSSAVRFTLLAARPARLRMELHFADRTEIQAFDGASPPWQSRSRPGQPPEIEPMPPAEAAAFTGDAVFEDPLVAGPRLGYRISFAGETKIADRTLLRVRVGEPSARVFFLLVDPGTHLIAARIEPLDAGPGGSGSRVTRYEDFRPVAGVLMPHGISLHAGGKPVWWARIDRIEPNPELPPAIFTRPPSPDAASAAPLPESR